MAVKVTHVPSLEEQERTNQILEGISAGVNAMAAGSAAPEFIDRTFETMLDTKNTTKVFRQWLAVARSTEQDNYKLLERWFGMMAGAIAGKVYTVQGHAATAASDSEMTPLDDLAPLGKAALATDTNDGGADWAEEHPLTWYVRFNGTHKEDGTMDIKAIEWDTDFDITGDLAPVFTASLALWKKETRDASYITKSWTSVRKAGFRPYAGDVDATGKKRVFRWSSTFGGGMTKDGTKLTSGAGTKPANYKNATAAIEAARKWGTHEALWGDTDTTWLLDMWQLRHQTKENSGYLEGCTGYNYQYQVAKAENGVRRVLVAENQGTNILPGSVVSVGTPGSNTNIDRGQGNMYSLANQVTVTSVVKVTEEGGTYYAVNLDLDKDIDVPAEGRVSTMPWTPGNTEGVPGHRDGCCGSLTDGKHPLRVAGIEAVDGAYAIGLDPLWNVTANTDGTTMNYEVYVVRDPTKQAGALAGYTKLDIVGQNFPKGSWQWPKEFIQNTEDILLPDGTFNGSATTYYRSGFSVSGSAGVFCPWRFCVLDGTGNAGLAGANGYSSPGRADWHGRGRLSGSGASRGEWGA